VLQIYSECGSNPNISLPGALTYGFGTACCFPSSVLPVPLRRYESAFPVQASPVPYVPPQNPFPLIVVNCCLFRCLISVSIQQLFSTLFILPRVFILFFSFSEMPPILHRISALRHQFFPSAMNIVIPTLYILLPSSFLSVSRSFSLTSAFKLVTPRLLQSLSLFD